MTDTTTHFNFELIDFNIAPWHTKEHANWIMLDAIINAYLNISNVVGIWKNSTAYVVPQRLIDDMTGQIFTCLVGHTTPATGTFKEYRIANPGVWERLTLSPTNRGFRLYLAAGGDVFTVPHTGKYLVFVTGGGGGSTFATHTIAGYSNGASGGNAGGTAIKFIDLVGGDIINVVVGAGGSALAYTGSNYATQAGSGGSSSFGGYCSATGGVGGYSPPIPTAEHVGQTAAISNIFMSIGVGGDINISGGWGISGSLSSMSAAWAGSGGASFWCGGGGAGVSPLFPHSIHGTPGILGSGAGGARGITGQPVGNGAVGGTGVVLILW